MGIVDRDRRIETEIQALKGKGIYTLDVAEVENLFCTPEIIKLVSERLARNPDEDFQKTSDFVIAKTQSEIENQISMRVASEIKYQLNCFNDKACGKDGLKGALSTLSNEIDVDSIYEENEMLFNNAVSNKDYLSILKLYNRKSLASQISSHLGLAHGELSELVVRLANGQEGDLIKQALKRYFGDFGERIA